MDLLTTITNEIDEAKKALAENEQLRITLAERDATIKAQADTIRLSQEEQKALQQEIENLNNTIKLLKEQLEKPVPPVVPQSFPQQEKSYPSIVEYR